MTPARPEQFPYRVTFQADDRTAEQYKRLAGAFGSQGYAWDYWWGEAGKLTFGFRNRAHRCTFSQLPLLHHDLPMGFVH
jgi:hypothetical protein